MLCFERLKEDYESCFYYGTVEFPRVVTYENHTKVLCVDPITALFSALYVLSDVQNVSVTNNTT
jgi:hypothetical protein